MFSKISRWLEMKMIKSGFNVTPPPPPPPPPHQIILFFLSRVSWEHTDSNSASCSLFLTQNQHFPKSLSLSLDCRLSTMVTRESVKNIPCWFLPASHHHQPTFISATAFKDPPTVSCTVMDGAYLWRTHKCNPLQAGTGSGNYCAAATCCLILHS